MSAERYCRKCGALLSTDAIAIYMKLVTREARDFLCIDCLSGYLSCTREAIEERIAYYKASGRCALFNC